MEAMKPRTSDGRRSPLATLQVPHCPLGWTQPGSPKARVATEWQVNADEPRQGAVAPGVELRRMTARLAINQMPPMRHGLWHYRAGASQLILGGRCWRDGGAA